LDGSDQDPDPAKRPVQATHLPHGAGPGLRWYPSGDWVFCISNNGVAATWARQGAEGTPSGKMSPLTPQGDAPPRNDLVVSPDGGLVAFTKPVPTLDAEGKRAVTYGGNDFAQIFVADFEGSRRERR